MVGDQLAKVYTVSAGATDISTIMLGVNDERIYCPIPCSTLNPTLQAVYHDGLLAGVAWLGLANKQTAQSVGGETGVWSTNTGISKIGRLTTVNGATKTFTVSGTAIYLSMMICDTSGGFSGYTISIDGNPATSFTSIVSGITTLNGTITNSRLHRFTGLTAGNHTILITSTGTGGIVVEWAGGNTQTVFPKVVVGNITRQSNTPGIGYSAFGGSDANVSSYNTDITNSNSVVVSALSTDGLSVTLADVNAALNNTTDLTSTDGLHPSQSGQNKIWTTFTNVLPPP